jgi:hypothetical protein
MRHFQDCFKINYVIIWTLVYMFIFFYIVCLRPSTILFEKHNPKFLFFTSLYFKHSGVNSLYSVATSSALRIAHI